MRPTRRSLLRAGAASLTALLGPACGRPARAADTRHIRGGLAPDHATVGHRLRERLSLEPESQERAEVLVLGAGVAGLAAAWRLEREGLRGVRVLELAAEPGGTSAGGELGGLRHPWGAHYLPVPRREQRALVALLEDLGLAHGFEPSGRLRVPEAHRVRAPHERLYELGFWQEGLWPRHGPTAEEQAQSERLDALLAEAARPGPDSGSGGARPFTLPLAACSDARRELDAMSAAAWAARHGLTSERLRWSLEYATRDDFGAALEDTSAFALLHYYLARQDGAGEGADYLTWPEGNAHLTEGLARGLEAPVLGGQLAFRVGPVGSEVEVDVLDLERDRVTRWRAPRVVLALPQFVVARLLAQDPARQARAAFRYSPWVVANLHLEEAPPTRGFPPAWDNVLRHSPSLGYVDATHQLDRDRSQDRLWTWYLPITDRDEGAARSALLATDWASWRDAVLADLAPAHPGLVERVTHLSVRRWGHAMVKPTPGFLWGPERAQAARPVGPVHLAHSDLSGMALFEEAHWQGVRAAEEVLAARGQAFESLLHG